ncbi:hypothetical protein E2566_08120 [Pectobacterium punjabense]|uniref:Transposase n=1 Tax=Pectobacterium punjabense TaxID=2108399 RepID=A0ABX6L0P0_9GAMM|nr:hypothetical protein [Pectobacterium punjabense]MBS4433267.1 hypothetical protein [Pectobacterium punjabense]PTA64120.1 hypothetical protein C9I36_11435 [Pectobacterium punjabense]QJA19886.1 hypothetical protein E2566_08120 [Pectobacterium punjabense]
MAKHINGCHEKKIVDLINTWPIDNKLTWDILCDKLIGVIGKRPSRQSLSSHVKIAESFNVKKTIIKSGEVHTVKPANLKVASQRIRRLEAENEALKALNSRYLERFEIWIYNAHLKKITLEELNNPLPAKYL